MKQLAAAQVGSRALRVFFFLQKTKTSFTKKNVLMEQTASNLKASATDKQSSDVVKSYAVLVASNLKEREKFLYFIPIDGNEAAVDLLDRVLNRQDLNAVRGEMTWYKMHKPIDRSEQSLKEMADLFNKTLQWSDYSSFIKILKSDKLVLPFGEEMLKRGPCDIPIDLMDYFDKCEFQNYFQ